MKKTAKNLKKPWGREIWIAQSKHYLGKIIHINKGHRLSRQYHRYKFETLYCHKGRCMVEVGGKNVFLNPGESICFRPNTIHRMKAAYEDVVLIEVSTSHPKDVIRIEDDYGRIRKRCD